MEMDVTESFTALVIQDAETILDFYQNTLGMKLASADPMDGGGVKYILKFKNGRMKLFAPEPKPEKKPPDFMGYTGYRLLTFVVNNMSEVYKELEDKGVAFRVPMQTTDDGTKWAIFADPEGNAIELAGKG